MYRRVRCSARGSWPRRPPPAADEPDPLGRPLRSEWNDLAFARGGERGFGIGALREKLQILSRWEQQGPIAALRHCQRFQGLKPLQRDCFTAIAPAGGGRRRRANEKISIESFGQRLRGNPMGEFDEIAKRKPPALPDDGFQERLIARCVARKRSAASARQQRGFL